MSEQTGSRKVRMSAIGGVITAVLGALEAFMGVEISPEVYLTIATIFGGAMLGNGMEHIGRGMGSNSSAPESATEASEPEEGGHG